MIDFGVGYLNMWTDQKRIAYVLKPGETALPASYQRAFDNTVRVRAVIRRTALLVIGGLNWGLVGAAGIDLVATLFGIQRRWLAPARTARV
jgi:hypothetical protein